MKLAPALMGNDWKEVRKCIDGNPAKPERRPLRATEVEALGEHIAQRYDKWAPFVRDRWPRGCAQLGKEAYFEQPQDLSQLLDTALKLDPDIRNAKISTYLLLCARAEAQSLCEDFGDIFGRRRRKRATITIVACRIVSRIVGYRLLQVANSFLAVKHFSRSKAESRCHRRRP
jgi:hypothetical protein